MKSLIVQGWRGINHSYAMVNQNQILEFLKCNIKLFHQDVPFVNPNWSIDLNNHGFEDWEFNEIMNVPNPSILNELPDIIYRLSFPYNFMPEKSNKIYVFGTSETQHINMCVHENSLGCGLDNGNLKVITPSKWSAEGFFRAGFQDDRVLIIPHGINEKVFKPPSSDSRARARMALGIHQDDFVLLSLGAMTKNKGVDLLIASYAILKTKYPNLRLILKDQSNLYKLTARQVFDDVKKLNPSLITDNLSESIIFVSKNLNLIDLSNLYGAADCYVSPYRAEGFNLPPLEAAACGLPIIVTGGGATDDYASDLFALKIESKNVSSGIDSWLEPSLDGLIDNIQRLIEKRAINLNSEKAQVFIKNNYTWSKIVKKLTLEFNGG